MKLMRIKAYVMLIVSGVVIVGTAVVVVLQSGNTAAIYLGRNYGTNAPGGVSTAWLMVLSMLAGMVLLGMFILLFKGLVCIRRAGSVEPPPDPKA